MIRDAVIGLGSNLGDRLAALRAAVDRLAARARVEACSSVYETDPVGPVQPLFLNAAVRIGGAFEPLELLDALLAIERELGRERRVRWGPRTVDLDLLWAGPIVVANPRLVVPHPELDGRAFALLPLLDVAPDARRPSDQVAYASLPAATRPSGVRLFASPLALTQPATIAPERAVGPVGARRGAHSARVRPA